MFTLIKKVFIVLLKLVLPLNKELCTALKIKILLVPVS